MNGNSRNHDNSDVGNLFGIKKTTYWEIYGVKRFPYRGKRKFTPLLYQCLDGGMMISNDVFGLTISQFERKYKACLERKKTKEQWILNLRYPDKSSNEYLEYLENCTDCNKDHLLWIENDPRKKYLYKHIVKTVGSEIDIRKRQRLFIIHDMIANVCVTSRKQILSRCFKSRKQISSGNLAEGLDLPGSDIYIMYEGFDVDIIQNEMNIKQPIHRAICVMETDIDHPGFTRLRLVANENGSLSVPSASYRGYLSVNRFLDLHKQLYPNMTVCVHGPCLSNENQTFDFAYCLRSKYLPHNAIPWVSRHQLQCPPNFVIDRIINNGCLLVSIGPKTIPNTDKL